MIKQIFWRDLRLAFRNYAEIINPLWFFLIIITLFPSVSALNRSCSGRLRRALSGWPRYLFRCWQWTGCFAMTGWMARCSN